MTALAVLGRRPGARHQSLQGRQPAATAASCATVGESAVSSNFSSTDITTGRIAPDTSLQRMSAKRSISPSPLSNSPAPERRAVASPSSTSYCVSCGSSSWPSQQQPQPSAPLYEREALSFSGAGEAFEAATSQQLGGSAGLTVPARVRRTNDCGPAWTASSTLATVRGRRISSSTSSAR